MATHEVENAKTMIQDKELSVANADFAAALAHDAPSAWGKGHLALYGCCIVIYLCSTMNGYDGSLMGSINALPNYLNYYNVSENEQAGTGIVFAIFQVGQMTGALFVWVADWKGRRWPIFIGCFGVMIGTIVTSTAKTMATFIGGRFLLSFFATWATTAAPMYVVEIAPPLYRGTVSGLYNTLWYMGSIIATFAVYGTHIHLSDSNLDWRLPLWLQLLCPGFVCILIWLLPESPRFLVANDSLEEARNFIVKFHANGDASHPIVRLELEEIQQDLRNVPLTSWRNFFDLRILVKSRSRRYRSMLNFAWSWFGQFSGNNVISYYLPLLLTNVGVTDTNTVLLLNAVYALTGWIAAAAGARFHDIIGRRKMMLGSTFGMIICLAITAGTAAGYVSSASQASSRASIAFIYIFGVVFAFAYTSMQPIYPAEVMSNEMRAKGMWLFQFTAGLASFVNTFAAPVALDNIGYWFYVFFVFWDCFELLFIYFFFVETKGRTLEELDEVFESKNPRKASTRKVAVRQQEIVDSQGIHGFHISKVN
ncbi:uncharacterized protein Z518_06515 [Rhinocladiella mackenziei CBS 650.93]|uniref:Major facilitator superfamily (MFS) profile domain-containing protein n=1 Tax=Rhinocladiella mackenziei CBS 650.93 TaxID=1442369 RepID=A0A0D2J242_9EURO|nr:uncharacterized protein Z518_06515 [Rhinocladiella mackenziei CBS 650.93]KIX02965.1 hypothetical protein Z518_06515 [Rhinocladiella mackenziei CBS 650.93]